MLWVIIPGNVETDWVGLHLVIVDVVDSHCVEVLPPHQLSRQGNRCPHRRLHLKMQCSGSCILLKNVCKMWPNHLFYSARLTLETSQYPCRDAQVTHRDDIAFMSAAFFNITFYPWYLTLQLFFTKNLKRNSDTMCRQTCSAAALNTVSFFKIVSILNLLIQMNTFYWRYFGYTNIQYQKPPPKFW